MLGETPGRKVYYAHSPYVPGQWQTAQTLHDHLLNVAERAKGFADVFGAGEEARLAGILHDLGKYADSFQRRLKGLEKGLDHWTPGAAVALSKEVQALRAALTIQGHHLGLRQADKAVLRAVAQCQPVVPELRVSESNLAALVERLQADGLPQPTRCSSLATLAITAAAMLDVRMLFSALVDADYLDTEEHFKKGEPDWRRPVGLPLEPEKAYAALLTYMEQVRRNARSSEHVQSLRDDLYEACVQPTSHSGLWTLTAPTGAGKTLAMLAFALRHAIEHDLRRIVVVIPFLTIIEQTANIYHSIFDAVFGDNYVLEHHSLTESGKDEATDLDDAAQREAQLLAENWDAPIILTTSVQMLESLHSNRPSACRKLHRLARSVILFDEVQTLPAGLALPTLATLSHLSQRYGSSVVFSTATQPAFSHLNRDVAEWNGSGPGWQPSEIVPKSLGLFSRARRTHVVWPDLEQRQSWPEVADMMLASSQALCIVNLKRHALALMQELESRGIDSRFHLSTSMCPAHREETLARVRAALDAGEPCHLVSTQCVEAGVDVDFPAVFRAFADLSSIAQAAGRCNRNGKLELCDVRVFVPDVPWEKAFPPSPGYEEAAAITIGMLKAKGAASMDISDPNLFHDYYIAYYKLARPHMGSRSSDIRKEVLCGDFARVADLYKLIDPRRRINLLVPWKRALERYQELADEVLERGLRRDWIHRARMLAISDYRPAETSATWQRLGRIPIGSGRGWADDWFIYCEPPGQIDYRNDVGLVPPEANALWIA